MSRLRFLTGMTSKPIVAALAALIVVGASACGGSRGERAASHERAASQGDSAMRDRGNFTDDVVAEIASAKVTKHDIDHWMATLAGGDFYQVGRRHAVPPRLASEPPNYAACAASLQEAVAKAARGERGVTTPTPSGTELLEKCHELYVALRSQATAYVIEGRWLIAVAAELGVRASETEIYAALRQLKAREYPGPGAFRHFLANSRRSIADERFVLKLDIVERRLRKYLLTPAKRVELLEAEHRVSIATNCRTGYVVPHCRQFKTSQKLRQPPSVLLEQVATITGIPCVNRVACG